MIGYLLFLSLVTATNLPLVLYHGMGDYYNSSHITNFSSLVKLHIPDILIHSIEIPNTDVQNSYFSNLNNQIAIVCNQLASIPALSLGFNAIGFSQGGLFLRAFIQKCPFPPVYNLITLGSPHSGVYDVPSCLNNQNTQCILARALIKNGVYLPWVQNNVVQAQYFRDFKNMDTYLRSNIFLPDINNELPKYNYSYTLRNLNAFVMVKYDNDSMLIPKESAWFSIPDEQGNLVAIQKHYIYTQERLGLKYLDSKNRLHFKNVSGDHLQSSTNFLVDEIIMPFLKTSGHELKMQKKSFFKENMKFIQTNQDSFYISTLTPTLSALEFNNNPPLISHQSSNLHHKLIPQHSKTTKYIIAIKRNNNIYYSNAIPLLAETHVISNISDTHSASVDKSLSARNSLGQEFGTNKRRKEIKSKQQNQINSVGLGSISADIHSSINAHSSDMISQTPTPSNNTMIPICHPDALTVKEVYLLEDIIPSTEYSIIPAKQMLQFSNIDDIPFIQDLNINNWIRTRMTLALQDKSLAKIKQLLYLAYLLLFFNTKDRDISPSRSIGGAPPAIAEALITKFTEYSTSKTGIVKYRMSAQLKDKLLSFIAALTLHIDDFVVDITALAVDLAMSTTRLSKIYKELGCRIDSMKKTSDKLAGKRAQLVIPLQFPHIHINKKR